MKREDIKEMLECIMTLGLDGDEAIDYVDKMIKECNGWIGVDSAEDLPMEQEVLCWDGCEFSIDYADMDPDSGTHYMANGTEVESYKLLTPPDSKK